MFVLIASSGPQRIDSKFVAGRRSRVGLKYLANEVCRGMFDQVSGLSLARPVGGR